MNAQLRRVRDTFNDSATTVRKIFGTNCFSMFQNEVTALQAFKLTKKKKKKSCKRLEPFQRLPSECRSTPTVTAQ